MPPAVMHLRSSIFRRLLIGALLLITVTLAVVNFYLSRFTSSREIQNVEQRMEAEARILQPQVGSIEVPQLQDWVRQAAQRSGARVTIVDPQGVVVAESR